MKKINVLGQIYKVFVKKYKDDEKFEKLNIIGYCNYYKKEIIICDVKTHPNFIDETIECCDKKQNEILRHEVVHSFLDESGLIYSSLGCESWATNEEMIDWIAIQFPKIYRIFKELNCLEDNNE